MKCKVCGTNFELKVDNHYIARDGMVIRTGISSLVGSSNEESKLYDTFDCPVCGCQNVVQERKRIATSRLYHTDEVVIDRKDIKEIVEESWCEEPTCDNSTEDDDESQAIPKCFGRYTETCICNVMEECKKETDIMEEE